MKALAVALAVAALPALAKEKAPRPAPARPEDDPRKKGDDKAFRRARVTFVSPRDGAQLPGGDVAVVLKVTGYALGDGPHLHLIVDNEPAVQLHAEGAYVIHGLEPGPHLFRAVLCRPWHEVVKARGAFALARLTLGPRQKGRKAKSVEAAVWPNPRKPLLTYVLPIGHGARSFEVRREDGSLVDSPPEPERPVLDYFVTNAKLARRGAKVRVVVDKRELPLATEWKPLPLRRTRSGKHWVTIDLLDRRGQKVHNAVNRTDRVFAAR